MNFYVLLTCKSADGLPLSIGFIGNVAILQCPCNAGTFIFLIYGDLRMKKSLIALAAMSAVAGTAQAQSSVSVYGILDSGYMSTEQDTIKFSASDNTNALRSKESKGITSSASSSSRLGFRGTEDLGGGLRAEFVVETGLNATNSTVSTFNNRQTFAGLTGGFGTFRIGTQYTAHHNIAAAFSPATGVNMAGDLNYSIGQSAAALTNLGITATAATISADATAATVNTAFNNVGNFTNQALSAIATAQTTSALQKALNGATTTALNNRLARVDGAGYTVRRNNTISYASPVMNGFQLGLGYNAPSTDKTIGGNDVKSSSQTISLSYTAGKFAAAAAHASGKTESVGADASTSRTAGLVTTYNEMGVANTTRVVSPIVVADSVVNASNTFTVKGQETMAAVSYNLGVAKLGYIYSTKKAKDQVSDLIDRKAHSVNATVPLGKVTAWANYGDGKQDVLSTNSYDLKAMQLGARYNFSKRTDVYAIYGQTKIDNKAANSIDLKDTSYAVGVRHQF